MLEAACSRPTPPPIPSPQGIHHRVDPSQPSHIQSPQTAPGGRCAWLWENSSSGRRINSLRFPGAEASLAPFTGLLPLKCSVFLSLLLTRQTCPDSFLMATPDNFPDSQRYASLQAHLIIYSHRNILGDYTTCQALCRR